MSLAVCARTLINGRVASILYLLAEISDGRAETLYNVVKEQLRHDNIPLENCIGFASDGAASMSGVENSLAAYLTKDRPQILIMKCLCHSAHFGGEYACRKLPRTLEHFVRNGVAFFSRSSNRQKALRDLQLEHEVPELKITSFCTTRWLTNRLSIERILDNWSVLARLFDDRWKSEKDPTAGSLLDNMREYKVRPSLSFLKGESRFDRKIQQDISK